MKKILILGPGCRRCHTLAETATIAAKELGLPYELEHITDINRYAEFGVMFTPALVVDGTLKVAGRLPSVAEIKKMLA